MHQTPAGPIATQRRRALDAAEQLQTALLAASPDKMEQAIQRAHKATVDLADTIRETRRDI